MKIFKDRVSAGKLLSKHLKKYKDKKNTLVLGIPRGGVVVAAEVAKQLHLPLDTMVIRKIGAPFQAELALGAVDPGGEVIWEESLLQETGFNKEQLQGTIDNELDELKRRENLYRSGKKPLELESKTIILVDDGIATGSTTLSAIRFLKRHEAKKIILAVPVASRESADRIIRQLGEEGELVVLDTPPIFQAVGQFYQHFEPVEDEEVIQLLNHG